MSNWIKGLFQSEDTDIIEETDETNETFEYSKKQKLGLTQDEYRLLVELVDKGNREFSFQPENIEYRDKALESALKIIEEEKIASIVNSLEKKGYLLKEKLEASVQCPNCYSLDIRVTFGCPKCDSRQVTKTEIFEHPYCGYRDGKSAFMFGGKLICPKCKSNLTKKENGKSISSNAKYVYVNSYRVNGSVFECKKCSNNISKPDIDFQCNNCETQFNYINGAYQTPIRYTISDDVFNNILSRNQANLLIVEDHATEAEVLCLLLDNSSKEIDYNITVASKGADALLTIENNDYDIVVLDLGLPDIKGLDLLKEIKNIRPNISVIVYTGYDDRDTAVKAMKIGASEFLIKNNDSVQALPDIVNKLLVNRHMID
jgi:CheY-like chemotaxis protein/Zn finger protein HypA/HybF involved in hydrogenase expression